MAAAVAAPHLQRVAVDIVHDLVAEAEEQQIRRRARGLGRLLLLPSQLFNKAQNGAKPLSSCKRVRRAGSVEQQQAREARRQC
jgi:hypothetical protein